MFIETEEEEAALYRINLNANGQGSSRADILLAALSRNPIALHLFVLLSLPL